jgi:colanic acid/amylovoran biosynthesis glycosyltransferase
VTPRVLHAVDQFLVRSETFVYTYLEAHRQFEASVICHGRANVSEFPFPRVHVCPRPTSRKTLDWWWSSAVEQVAGRSPWRKCADSVLASVAPAVVHAHFGPTGCEMIAPAHARGIPLVTSLYGVDAAVLPYLPQWRERYARLFAEGDLFLAEGPEMRRKIIAAGAPVARTVIQPVAVRLDKYPPWTPDRDAPTVLFVGRFVAKKGLLDAIAAFGRAHASVAARMTIVGEGPDERSARALVARLGLADVVDFVGMRPHADVIARLRRAAVVIHPSVTAADGDSEGGAPTLLLEAQAVGTPIVTTRHADIPHVVPEGAGVFLCDEHDVDALASGLVSALERREASSAAHVQSHHEVRQAIEQLESLYLATVSSAATKMANCRWQIAK